LIAEDLKFMSNQPYLTAGKTKQKIGQEQQWQQEIDSRYWE